MPAQLPESQPALPIFGEESVWYHKKPSVDQDPADYEENRTQSLTVNDIDSLEDPALRGALWHQFGVRTTPRNRMKRHYRGEVLTVHANADDTFSHTITTPRGDLKLSESNGMQPPASIGRGVEATPLANPPQATSWSRFMRRVVG